MVERLPRPYEAAQLVQPDTISEKPKWQTAGEYMARFFSEQVERGYTPRLLLDVDGVILQGDNLTHHELISESIVPAIVALEEQGVEIGLATSRPRNAVEFLRSQTTFDGKYAPRLVGPNVLEHGHLVIHGEKEELTGHPNHHACFQMIEKTDRFYITV